MNHFELFEIEPALTVDAASLQTKYYQLARQWHPDKFVGQSDEKQQQALAQTEQINQAFRLLSSPFRTIEYALLLMQKIVPDEKFQLPNDFLMEMMDINETIAELIHTYFGLKLPNIKVAVTGSGRVASGLLEIMNLLDIKEVEPEDYLSRTFDYPVFVHLKGRDLYRKKEDGTYQRDEFHAHPELYNCTFLQYAACTDILMNGIYWDERIPRLFELADVKNDNFKIKVLSDVTCDINGSIPCNLGATTIEDPVYGFDRTTGQKSLPYQNDTNSIDVMAVDNLPNELPRDASHYFGEFMEKYVLNDLLHNPQSPLLQRATICENGKLSSYFEYLSDYAYR